MLHQRFCYYAYDNCEVLLKNTKFNYPLINDSSFY